MSSEPMNFASAGRSAPRRPASRLPFALVLAVLAAGASACLEDVTGLRDLTMSLQVAPTTLAVGDTLDLTYAATGTGLVLVVLDYGDGTVDSTTYGGPVEAAADRTHVYAASGSYLIVGAVTGVDGTASDSATVTVN